MEEPIVHLSDLRVRDVQLFEQRYTLALRVENPNPQELPVNGLSYRVLLNKVELGRGASRQSVTIPPYGESVIEVDLVSNTLSLLPRVRDIGSGTVNGVRVSITGNMNLTNRATPLPFSFQGDFGAGQS
jgi:LEA14-like dessication related protein